MDVLVVYLYTHSLALAMSAQRGGMSACTRIPLLWPCPHSVEGCLHVHAFPGFGHVRTAWRDVGMYTHSLALAMSAQRGGISACTRIPLLWPCPHSVEGCLHVHAFPCSGHVCTAARRRFPEGFPAHCLRCLSADHPVNTVTPPLHPLINP